MISRGAVELLAVVTQVVGILFLTLRYWRPKLDLEKALTLRLERPAGRRRHR